MGGGGKVPRMRVREPFYPHPRYHPSVGVLVHRRLAHQYDDRQLVRHSATHPRHPPKVLLEPLDPVRRVDHRLDVKRIVQVREVERYPATSPQGIPLLFLI